ncbi:hypothetical protein [Reyranella sp.]|uniref:hypothetical protein n=1 Tax=Reyranella sp. TaxID=1929291 RepID=UPI0037837EC3
MAEDLITGLSRVSWLFVLARNSSFVLRGEKLDARSIGERLGVRYLVEGRHRRKRRHRSSLPVSACASLITQA